MVLPLIRHAGAGRHPGGCVVMRKCPTFVIPSAARDLVFSAAYEEEISRLHLEMTVATQSPGEGGDGYRLSPV